MPYSNRRDSERIEKEIVIHCDKNEPFNFALLTDLSESGFQAIVYSKYIVDTLLKFNLVGPLTEFRCQGSVKWMKKIGFFRKKYRVGIRLIGNKIPQSFRDEVHNQ